VDVAREPWPQWIDWTTESVYVGYMRTAKISEAKNNLSKLIDAVRRGQTVLILSRDTPVARLEPVGAEGGAARGRLGDLVKRGLVAPPRAKLDVGGFLARNMAKPRGGASVVEALLREREAGR
jgi:prevent-host-death family protein